MMSRKHDVCESRVDSGDAFAIFGAIVCDPNEQPAHQRPRGPNKRRATPPLSRAAKIGMPPCNWEETIQWLVGHWDFDCSHQWWLLTWYHPIVLPSIDVSQQRKFRVLHVPAGAPLLV